MARRVSAVLMGLILALSLAVPVAAGTQGSCSGSDPNKVLLWENSIGGTIDGNDNLWKCGDSDANFQNDAHTLPGGCNPIAGPWDDDWNDCVSSVTVYLDTGHYLCVHQDVSNGGNTLLAVHGPIYGTRYNLQINDVATSYQMLPYIPGQQLFC